MTKGKRIGVGRRKIAFPVNLHTSCLLLCAKEGNHIQRINAPFQFGVDLCKRVLIHIFFGFRRIDFCDDGFVAMNRGCYRRQEVPALIGFLGFGFIQKEGGCLFCLFFARGFACFHGSFFAGGIGSLSDRRLF